MPDSAHNPPTISAPVAHTMQCMEVWGGNRAINNGVAMPGLDAWVYALPLEGNEAGGDVHYVSSCATGRITRLLVADVAGHGSAVDELALGLRSLLRRYVNYYDQAAFVRTLNDKFGTLSEGCRFATAIVATYWGPTGKLSLCNAGHPRPLLYRAKQRTWTLLDRTPHSETDMPRNIPLGIQMEVEYAEIELALRRDDLLLIYTDSLIESRDPEGHQLGEDGLLELVQRVDMSQPQSFIRTLTAEIEAFRRYEPSEDDLTIMVVRNNGVGLRRMNMATGLAAGARVVLANAAAVMRGDRNLPLPQWTAASILGAFSSRVSERVRAKEER